MKVLWFKRRDYPIKRDENGRSLRQQAFELFNEGHRPAQISKESLIAASKKTLFRYFEDWKKQKHRMSRSILKKYMKKNPEFSDEFVKKLADYYGVPKEDIILRIQKPWGIKQLAKGELPDHRLARIQNENEERLEAALRLIYFGERLCRNSPEQNKRLLQEIVTLKDNTTLIISKVKGQTIIRKEKLQG